MATRLVLSEKARTFAGSRVQLPALFALRVEQVLRGRGQLRRRRVGARLCGRAAGLHPPPGRYRPRSCL